MDHNKVLVELGWSWGGEPIGTLERDAITALRAALDAPDGDCRYCTDGCIACDARKLQGPVAMTRDNIIRMAREAGLEIVHFTSPPEAIERFAALVAAATRESMKAEGWRPTLEQEWTAIPGTNVRLRMSKNK